jgi:hypothetical protein
VFANARHLLNFDLEVSEIVWQENEGGGALPLEGTIPDMTATTELYLKVQRAYRTRAETHCAAVTSYARSVLREAGVDQSLISDDFVRLFCKNARSLRIVKSARVSRPLKELNASALTAVCYPR